MTETHYIGLLSTSFFTLLGLLSWIGVRIFGKLDGLSSQLVAFRESVQKQITDGDNILHHRVNELDRRVTRVETKCSIEHDQRQQ